MSDGLKKLFRNKIIVFLVAIIAALFSIIFFEEKAAVLNSAFLSSYNIDSHPQNATKQINAAQDISISCKFNFWGFKDQYEGLFQTSNANKGVRLELANAGVGTWGIVLPGQKDGDIQVVNLGDMPNTNVWHTLQVNIKNNDIEAYVDGTLKGKAHIQNPNFLIDDIEVGTGFSKDRRFNGEISNFNLEKRHNTVVTTYGVGLLLQLIFVLILIIICSYSEISMQSMFNELKTVKVNLLFIVYCFIFVVLFGLICNTFQKNISNYRFICLEIYFSLVICIRLLWTKFHFNNFLKIMFLLFALLFTKKFYLNISFLGVVSDTLLIYTVFGIIESIPIFIRYKFSFAVLFSIISSVLGGLLILGAMYMHRLNTKTLLQDELFALFQTNLRESKEFLTSFFTFHELVFMMLSVIACGVVIFMIINSMKGVQSTLPFLTIFLVSTVIFTWLAGFGQSAFSPVFVLAKGYKQSINQMQYYQNLRNNDKKISATKEEHGETYVIVIGESGNKRHYSAYGYFRDTTPWLASYRNKDNAIFLENAYASFVHTVPSLMKALTSANQYNKELDFAAPSIVEIANAAGFNTYWISNQNRNGLVDNPLTVLADKAKYVSFTARTGLDEELLPLINKQLANIDASKNNVIFVHMIGSHADYRTRIPKDYDTNFIESGEEYLGNNARDKDFVQNILNPYDASTRYTGNNLERIYQAISQKVGNISAFIYMPDHGEDVYGKKFHNAAIFTYEMARVPVFMVFSNKYKEKYNGKFEQLKRNKSSVFTTDLFFDLCLGLMNIKSNIYLPKYDVSSDKYSINWNNAITLWSDDTLQRNLYTKVSEHKVSDDPEYIKRQNMKFLNGRYGNKFFAIYSDVVGAAIQAVQDGFTAIEVNVTAKDGKLLMGHGPQFIYNMSLDEYLSKIPFSKLTRIYLDLKILDKAEIDTVYTQLTFLDKKYGLKNKALVESSLIDDKMIKFKNDGWHTVFYFLPETLDKELSIHFPANMKITNDVVDVNNITEETNQQLSAYGNTIAKVICNQNSVAISDVNTYNNFVFKYITPAMPYKLKYCTWSIPKFPSLFDKDFNRKISNISVENDHEFEAILINQESMFAITF